MNEQLEQELRRALGRVPAPEGFAARVLERAGEAAPYKTGRAWWYAAVAAVIVVALLLTGVRRYQREVQAQQTERQVVFAFALAAEKLQHVNVNLERSSAQVKIQKRQERRYE